MDIQTPTDNSDDNEDNEPDNNACKRQRKTYALADTVRKVMTKKRQADLLKKQQEREKAKASKEKPDNANRPRAQKSKGKHPTLIKSKVLKRVEGQLEHIMIICYHMIPNLEGHPR